MVSFEVQVLLISMKSHWPNFSFDAALLLLYLRKSCLHQYHEYYPLFFSPRSFTVLVIIFKPMISFELIFVNDMSPHFTFLHVDVQFPRIIWFLCNVSLEFFPPTVESISPSLKSWFASMTLFLLDNSLPSSLLCHSRSWF